MTVLKGWRLLRKLQCSTNSITDIVKAVLVLHHASTYGKPSVSLRAGDPASRSSSIATSAPPDNEPAVPYRRSLAACQQEERVTRSIRRDNGSGRHVPSSEQKLKLSQWHLDRYDRLRSSTASRASVVLSAGAILSAGNAVVLVRLIDGPDPRINSALALLFGTGLLTSTGLVVLSLIFATGVLITPKDSREIFGDGPDLPLAVPFNPSDTVRELKTYTDFSSAINNQDYAAMVEAAQVELWNGIRQHRLRYLRLRSATRVLRWAALTFLVSLAGFVITMLSKVHY